MSKNLVIVESPAKAKTIGKYLGKDYTVEASIGHIMDLPKNDIGVELKRRTFEPTLIVSPGKEKIVAQLKRHAAKADAVFLAPDPDREGEAIAAHLRIQLLPSLKKGATLQRVTFNEITQKAVKAAFAHARDVDENLVDAQQTRRVLDRLVGYQISPLLWDKVKRGLSAGRVQTVALRLIVEREREINAFPSTEYWNIDAVLTPAGETSEFVARMVGVNGEPLRVADLAEEGKYIANALPDQGAIDEVLPELEKAVWRVRSVEKKEVRRNPRAPFTTSQLQQQAAARLGFNVRRTMGVAQRLYEGVEIGNEGTVGLITYMRTDSTRISPDAVQEIRDYIAKDLGAKYLPAAENVYKSKKAVEAKKAKATRDAKAAAEAATAEKRLADASDANADDATSEESSADRRLPELNDGQALAKQRIDAQQKFTQPPPRFNEASLVKILEEKGIGRPSTYASIINTIQERDYVKKLQKKLVPTEMGMVVTELLVKNFPYIFETGYTAQLEGELDAVEDGTEKWTDLLNGFYDHFEEELKVAATQMEDVKAREIETDEICEKCGARLMLKWGKFGSFYSCSNFTNQKPITFGLGPFKKDPKAALQKITTAFHFPVMG